MTSLAAFMTSLDNTVVNVALPAIQRDLGLTLAGLEWVVTGYILAFAGLLLTGGRLADRHGRDRAFLAGTALFTAASLAAGLAPTASLLLAARIVQGAGAALVLPATLAILATDLTARARLHGFALWTAAVAVSLALGPLVGGALSQHAHWSWIFLVNVPAGAVTLLVARHALPRADVEARRLDLPGLVTSAIALTAATYVLVQGHEHGWTATAILVAAAIAVTAALAFAAVESRAPDPLIDLALFRAPAFGGGIAITILSGLGVNGIFFFTALVLQTVLGLSPTETGLAFVPIALCVAAATPLAPYLARRWGTRPTVTAGLLLLAAGLAGAAAAGRDEGVPGLLIPFAAVGMGSALTAPLTAVVLETVPTARAGTASGLLSVAREISGVVGIGVIGAVVATRQAAARHTGTPVPDALMSGYSAGLALAAVLVLAGAAISVATLRSPPR
ncbi:MFS transporter [Spirillospora sp. CA-294931]|uniref:MFS transporter n=1 Tax=Spirillospora sp. CA-294931 TaxID=3240042 RepID=UPI003D940F21